MYDLFSYGTIGRYWFDYYRPSMYEVGRYFLQHKFVVKRCKKRGRRK